ncbi:agmatine deiminase [Acidihalobacter prosperus]|uniref:Agmatine deiminase n=2 Tax=Acidihalobacter prosperus TaxID=160660 RepID=A0A1A6C8I3_9GAMM|nr:agmatine deiminase [Acidihalobacter prosperus]
MLTWPHPGTAWAPQLAAVEQVYTELAQAITRHESLLVVCRDEAHREGIAGRLKAHGVEHVRFALAPSNDTWARDHGPIGVYERDRPRLLDFVFNGWGGKHAYVLDDAINAHLAEAGCFAAPMEHVDFILEGGAIDSDGAGSLLTTRHCLMTPTRNATLDEAAIEARLRALFGVSRILWLSHGELAGDDTDGHIDTLARFCDPGTIAYASCDDPDDEHFAGLAAMAEELRALRQPSGAPYRLLPLPLPRAHHDATGQRLPATYANFLIINGAVLVPTYEDSSADARALGTLAEAFPDREIIGIGCVPLIQQYGSLHCVTMQLPAGSLVGMD